MSKREKDRQSASGINDRAKKGGKGGSYTWEGDGSEDVAPLDKGDPNYVSDDEAAEAAAAADAAERPRVQPGSPSRTHDPSRDSAIEEPVSVSPTSGRQDPHSAFNERNFFGAPIPALDPRDLDDGAE